WPRRRRRRPSWVEPQLRRETDALQLAGGTARQLGDEDDLVRDLVMREVLLRVVAELALGGRLALLEHHRRRHLLAQLVVRNSKSKRELDGGVVHQDDIHLQRRYLLSSPVDHLLQAAADAEISLSVQRALVPGAEPAVGERPGVGLRIVQVAAGHVGAANHDLAAFPSSQWKKRSALKPGVTHTCPPADSDDSTPATSPWMWKSGMICRPTSAGERESVAAMCRAEAVRFACVSGTSLGRAVVPLVCRRS